VCAASPHLCSIPSLAAQMGAAALVTACSSTQTPCSCVFYRVYIQKPYSCVFCRVVLAAVAVPVAGSTACSGMAATNSGTWTDSSSKAAQPLCRLCSSSKVCSNRDSCDTAGSSAWHVITLGMHCLWLVSQPTTSQALQHYSTSVPHHCSMPVCACHALLVVWF
jgi:hypothetical protein